MLTESVRLRVRPAFEGDESPREALERLDRSPGRPSVTQVATYLVIGGLEEGRVYDVSITDVTDSERRGVMSWLRGPVPQNTHNFGAVVLKKDDKPRSGFYFADFMGDHVRLIPTGQRVELDQVELYNNSIDLPQGVVGRVNDSHEEPKVGHDQPTRPDSK